MIAVMVSPALGKWLHQYGDLHHIPQKKKYTALINWLSDNQSTLTATFPGIADEHMKVYFSVQSATPSSDAALKKLQGLAGIQSAIRKPEDSLPG
jgi:hypothetical protein